MMPAWSSSSTPSTMAAHAPVGAYTSGYRGADSFSALPAALRWHPRQGRYSTSPLHRLSFGSTLFSYFSMQKEFSLQNSSNVISKSRINARGAFYPWSARFCLVFLVFMAIISPFPTQWPSLLRQKDPALRGQRELGNTNLVQPRPGLNGLFSYQEGN